MEKGAELLASITTNGTLLTSQAIEQLVGRLKVSRFMLTLDGPRHIHDSRRVSLTGDGTFDRIVDNVMHLLGLAQCIIRCTVDDDNSGDAWSLYDYLSDRGVFADGNAHFMLGYTSVAESPGVCYISCDVLNTLASGYISRADAPGIVQPYPGPHLGCAALDPNALVIAPNGEIHRCINTIGRPEEAVGSVYGEYASGVSRVPGKWDQLDPFGIQKCRACSWLPACLGGCAKTWIEAGNPVCPLDLEQADAYLVAKNARIEHSRRLAGEYVNAAKQQVRSQDEIWRSPTDELR